MVILCTHNFAVAGNHPNGLPVFATTLSVSVSGQNMLISWQADKEAFSYYEVERSTDAVNFSTIGLVLDAPENSNICLFKDRKTESLAGKTVWYRIKAIAKEGVFSYSNSISYISEKTLASTCETEAFPNPFKGGTALKFKSSEVGFAQISVQNLDGQTLLSKQSHIIKGYNNINLDGLASLSRGIYIARLSINGTVAANQKLIKK